MALVPAVCERETCGAVFATPNVLGGGLWRDIEFKGVKVGPCPACGAMGRIPDGVFNFTENTIELLSAPEHSREDLRRLAAVLAGLDIAALDRDAVVAAMERESPGLGAALAALLPQDRGEWLAYMGILLGVVQIMLSFLDVSDRPPTPTPAQVEQIVDEALRRVTSTTSPTTTTTAPPEEPSK